MKPRERKQVGNYNYVTVSILLQNEVTFQVL